MIAFQGKLINTLLSCVSYLISVDFFVVLNYFLDKIYDRNIPSRLGSSSTRANNKLFKPLNSPEPFSNSWSVFSYFKGIFIFVSRPHAVRFSFGSLCPQFWILAPIRFSFM